MLTILKHFLLTGIDGRKKRFEESRSRSPEGLRSSGLGAAPQQAEKTIRSVEAEWMVFRICITDALLASIIPNWLQA